MIMFSIFRAGAMYNISSDQSRQTKSSRAGVFLDIGKVIHIFVRFIIVTTS